jgi:hypothetical protein
MYVKVQRNLPWTGTSAHSVSQHGLLLLWGYSCSYQLTLYSIILCIGCLGPKEGQVSSPIFSQL